MCDLWLYPLDTGTKIAGGPVEDQICFTLRVKFQIRTSQKTQFPSIAKTSQLPMFRKIIGVCCNDHVEQVNTFCGQNSASLALNLAVLVFGRLQRVISWMEVVIWLLRVKGVCLNQMLRGRTFRLCN